MNINLIICESGTIQNPFLRRFYLVIIMLFGFFISLLAFLSQPYHANEWRNKRKKKENKHKKKNCWIIWDWNWNSSSVSRVSQHTIDHGHITFIIQISSLMPNIPTKCYCNIFSSPKWKRFSGNPLQIDWRPNSKDTSWFSWLQNVSSFIASQQIYWVVKKKFKV